MCRSCTASRRSRGSRRTGFRTGTTVRTRGRHTSPRCRRPSRSRQEHRRAGRRCTSSGRSRIPAAGTCDPDRTAARRIRRCRRTWPRRNRTAHRRARRTSPRRSSPTRSPCWHHTGFRPGTGPARSRREEAGTYGRARTAARRIRRWTCRPRPLDSSTCTRWDHRRRRRPRPRRRPVPAPHRASQRPRPPRLRAQGARPRRPRPPRPLRRRGRRTRRPPSRRRRRPPGRGPDRAGPR